MFEQVGYSPRFGSTDKLALLRLIGTVIASRSLAFIVKRTIPLQVSSSKLISPTIIPSQSFYHYRKYIQDVYTCMDEKRANGSASLSRREREEVWKERGVRKCRCRSVFALTRWRLVHGYPNERKATHESTCGACPPRFCSFFTLLRLPLSLPRPPLLSLSSSPRPRWPSVLSLTCSLTYGSSADRSRSTGLFKGISTIFDSGFHTRRDLVTTRGRSENYDASRRCDTQARCEKIRGTTNYGSSFGETFCAYR